VSEGETDLEALDVGEVAGEGAKECGRDAHCGEVEGADGDAACCDAREVVLRRELARDETEDLHGSAGEDGRGGSWVATEGAEVWDVGWGEAQGAVVVA